MFGLRYAEFSVPLVKALKELDQKAKDQEVLIEQLEAIVKMQEEQITSLEKLGGGSTEPTQFTNSKK